MTDHDPAGPQLLDDETARERFKDIELPDGVDADEAIARVRRAFDRIGSRKRERRAREVAAFQASERAEALRLNRGNALRTVTVDGVTQFYSACACRWHGLRVSDPEVALREYDAHPCTIPLDQLEADHPAFRELRIVDGKLVKRPASVLALNQVMPDGTIVNTITQPIDTEVKQATAKHGEDEFAVRAALLELK